MPKIKLDNTTLYCRICGKGFPLLLIAGLGSDNSSWLNIINKLSENFQVITFDNRGAGRSEIPKKPYTIRQMADDTIKLLDYLKIKKTHVIGHSMGGYIAQELALNYPKYIDKLILESTAPISTERNNTLFEFFFNQFKKGGDSEIWFWRWAFWLFSPKTFNNKKFIKAFIKNGSRYPYLQLINGFKYQINAIVSFDTRNKLHRIKAETLVVHGTHDVLILPEEAEALVKNISNSDFQLLKDTGHAIHIENPGLFVKVILRFINTKKR